MRRFWLNSGKLANQCDQGPRKPLGLCRLRFCYAYRFPSSLSLSRVPGASESRRWLLPSAPVVPVVRKIRRPIARQSARARLRHCMGEAAKADPFPRQGVVPGVPGEWSLPSSPSHRSPGAEVRRRYRRRVESSGYLPRLPRREDPGRGPACSKGVGGLNLWTSTRPGPDG